jgi:hypothetical protein
MGTKRGKVFRERLPPEITAGVALLNIIFSSLLPDYYYYCVISDDRLLEFIVFSPGIIIVFLRLCVNRFGINIHGGGELIRV